MFSWLNGSGPTAVVGADNIQSPCSEAPSYTGNKGQLRARAHVRRVSVGRWMVSRTSTVKMQLNKRASNCCRRGSVCVWHPLSESRGSAVTGYVDEEMKHT